MKFTHNNRLEFARCARRTGFVGFFQDLCGETGVSISKARLENVLDTFRAEADPWVVS